MPVWWILSIVLVLRYGIHGEECRVFPGWSVCQSDEYCLMSWSYVMVSMERSRECSLGGLYASLMDAVYCPGIMSWYLWRGVESVPWGVCMPVWWILSTVLVLCHIIYGEEYRVFPGWSVCQSDGCSLIGLQAANPVSTLNTQLHWTISFWILIPCIPAKDPSPSYGLWLAANRLQINLLLIASSHSVVLNSAMENLQQNME